MYFNTVIKNETDKEIRVSYIGKSTVVIAPGKTITVPYEVLGACRTSAQKSSLISAMQNGVISLEYKTDAGRITEEAASKKKAEPKKAAPAPAAEPEKTKEPEVKQEDILPEKAKAAIQAAEEGTGIIEGATSEELLPKAITLGDDEPIQRPEDVKLEDVLEGKVPMDVEPSKADVIADIQKAAPKPKKAPATKKPAARKKVVKMD